MSFTIRVRGGVLFSSASTDLTVKIPNSKPFRERFYQYIILMKQQY